MKNAIAVLKDNSFFADLLNGPCKPTHEPRAYKEGTVLPINPDWIDDDMSERLTKVYHDLIPGEMPFETLVRVVKNPDVLMNGVAVDDGKKRTRYIVVMVVNDTEFPYDLNFPLIQCMGIVSLGSWEMTRAVIAASKEYARVQLVESPTPPILNNAIIEWVSLYVGKKGFTGPTNLKETAIMKEDSLDDLDTDTNLYDLRSIDDPLVKRLLEAVDIG